MLQIHTNVHKELLQTFRQPHKVIKVMLGWLQKPATTVVWEKFTIGYFHVRIVPDKIVLSLGVSNKKFLTTNYF